MVSLATTARGPGLGTGEVRLSDAFGLAPSGFPQQGYLALAPAAAGASEGSSIARARR